jgi:hypothetical protein
MEVYFATQLAIPAYPDWWWNNMLEVRKLFATQTAIFNTMESPNRYSCQTKP